MFAKRCVLLLATAYAATVSRDAQFMEQSFEAARRFVRPSSVTLHEVVTDLHHLQAELSPRQPKAFLQVADGTAPSKSETKATPKKKHLDAATALKEMKGLGAKDLPGMMVLMSGMYDSWKDKIGEANKHEEGQKKEYEATIKDLETKKGKAKTQLEKDNLDRIERYWKKQRALAHRQYHTSLKIMHGGMSKFKVMMGAMDDAQKGKKPSKKDLSAVGLMPDVCFVQLRELKHWTAGSLAAAAHA